MKPYYQDKWVTIYNCDCRDLLQELSTIDVVITDPPYGADIEYISYTDTYENWKKLIDDTLPSLLKLASVVLLACGRIEGERYIYANYKPDWRLCWYKGATSNRSVIGFKHWEMIFFWGKRSFPNNCPDYFMATPQRFHQHPCPKPETWADWLLLNFSAPHDTVLDPFLGSGTTAYCAKKLNRKCIGIEIEERYCEIAAKRCCQEVFEI